MSLNVQVRFDFSITGGQIESGHKWSSSTVLEYRMHANLAQFKVHSVDFFQICSLVLTFSSCTLDKEKSHFFNLDILGHSFECKLGSSSFKFYRKDFWGSRAVLSCPTENWSPVEPAIKMCCKFYSSRFQLATSNPICARYSPSFPSSRHLNVPIL